MENGDFMISVIIPVYNEEKSIGKTIDDIIKNLKKIKLYKSTEIIVVNDGSIDSTSKVLEKYPVKVLNNPYCMGYGYSLKKGISEAQYETIIITDADSTYPFDSIQEMLDLKAKGYDLVIGARTGKYYKESIQKSLMRKMLKQFIQFVSGKKIKDVNSGLRIFDKSTVLKFFPVLCNTFSFTTSQTLAYLMNCLFVGYVDIEYHKRVGKSKVKLFKDAMKALQYIVELGVYYNPLRVFSLMSFICIILAMIGFLFSHFAHIKAGYILGLLGLQVSIIVFCIGFLAALLKQILNKK